jgi:5-methylcytosine-specific restriction endonuclease McrBC GTP-binding regulatory subunit McrB
VCLDEMNLAHVEYYLADFLSAMETDDKTIDLQTGEIKDENIKQDKINIPPNFYVIGTVNIDETTKEFSPKVLDRANSIEMDAIDLEKWKELQQPFVKINETAFEVIKKIHTLLKKNNLHFGYRVCIEIMKYIENSSLDLDRSIDLQIKQKILPKLSGDNNSRLRSSLEELKDYLATTKYEQSLAKTESMLKQLAENGFATFYE